MSAPARSSVVVGHGARRFVETHRRSTVVGVFRTGFYLGAGSDVMAVVGREVSPGPINLRVDGRLRLPAEGTVCLHHRSSLRCGPLTIELVGAEPFAPTLPDSYGRADLLRALPVDVPPDLADVWTAAESSVHAGRLEAARDLLAGRGRGLTPDGDDVLAGLCLVLASDESHQPVLLDLVAGAETTDLSRSFLRWAAVGHSVSEVHDLLWAVADGDRSAFDRAERRVRRLGRSTGPALLLGLRLGAVCRAAGAPAAGVPSGPGPRANPS